MNTKKYFLVLFALLTLMVSTSLVLGVDRTPPTTSTIYSWADCSVPSYGLVEISSDEFERLGTQDGDNPFDCPREPYDQTGIDWSDPIETGNNLDLDLTIWNTGWEEYLGIWIDWNQDGDFDDSGEFVVDDFLGNWTGYIYPSYTISVPEDAELGTTYMRAVLLWDEEPESSGFWDFGDVEDYEIEVVDGMPPEISDMTNNPEYPTCDDDTIIICADVTDDSNFDVDLSCTADGYGTASGPMYFSEGDTYCRSISTGTLFGGPYCTDNVDVDCTVTAIDEFDNEATPLTEEPLFTYDNAPPTADANGPYTCDEGDTIDLDGTGSWDTVTPYGDLIFEWDFDNDELYDDAFGDEPEYYCADGDAEITISLKVTDNAGFSATDDATIEIDNVDPTADANGDYECDEGQTIQLDASDSWDPAGVYDTLSYYWDFDDSDGLTYEDATGINPDYICGDGYDEETVYLQVTDEDGGVGYDDADVTIYNLPPKVTIDDVDPQPVDEGSEVTVYVSFTDYITDTHTATIDWDDGYAPEDLGTVTSPFEAPHTYCNQGEYTVEVTISDNEFANGFDDYVITVSNVAPTASFTGPDRAILDETVYFDGSATDPGCDTLTYFWDFDYDGITFDDDEIGQNPSTSYSERGTYTVALRVHDGQEYSEIVTQEITIYDYQIDFTEDWNLISLPEVPEDDDTSIESVFDDVLENINIIWSYQMGEWKVYSEGPQDLTDIIPGYGYYVDVNDDVTSYQNGEKMYGNDGWTVPKPPVVTLTPSWNLIGHYGMNEGLSRAESFTTIEGYYATILDVNGMPTYEFYPTEGYWLFLTGINNMDYAPSDAAYDY